MADPDKKVQFDETDAYSKQLSPMLLSNFSISYKINKKKVAHEFAFQIANATGYKEYFGHVFNTKKNKIEPNREAITLTNVSYKIQF